MKKWSDTKMIGILKLVMVQEVDVPIVNVRMSGTDPADAERGIILEYELPLNFNINSKLSKTFSSLQIQKEEFLSFLFANESDRCAWDMKIEEVQKKLVKTTAETESIRSNAKSKMDDEFSNQLEQNIKVDELLAGTDIEA